MTPVFPRLLSDESEQINAQPKDPHFGFESLDEYIKFEKETEKNRLIELKDNLQENANAWKQSIDYTQEALDKDIEKNRHNICIAFFNLVTFILNSPKMYDFIANTEINTSFVIVVFLISLWVLTTLLSTFSAIRKLYHYRHERHDLKSYKNLLESLYINIANTQKQLLQYE